MSDHGTGLRIIALPGLLVLLVLVLAIVQVQGDVFQEPSSSSSRPFDDFDLATIESPWDHAVSGPAAAGLEASFDAIRSASTMFAYERRAPFEAEAESEDLPPPARPRIDGEGLYFDAASGAALWILEVRPDTPYVFRMTSTRSAFPEGTDLDERAGELSAFVGGAALFELHQPPNFAGGLDPFQSLGDVLATAQASRHVLAVPDRPDHPQQRETVFKSTVFTRHIAILLCAGNPGWWRSSDGTGAAPPTTIRFQDVKLFELPLARYLGLRDRTVQDDLLGVTESADSSPYLQKTKITGDLRRAAIALPGTRIDLPLRLPAGRFHLSLSYGIVEERRKDWGLQPVRFRATLVTEDDRQFPPMKGHLAPGVRVEDHGWHEFHLRGASRSEAATLILQTWSDSPHDVAVFGEPRLVSLRAQDPRPNVLFISLDTLRADHLGCYGYEHPLGSVSPHIDALAADSLLFEKARTVAPYTLPSHATMMTGLMPQVHGVLSSGQRLVDGVHPLLARAFQEAGYATAAFTGGGFVSYEYGFHHGFDQYSIYDPLLTVEDPLRNDFPRPGDRAFNDAMYARYDLAAVKRWIEQRADSPFFLFLHTFEVHNYHPPEELERQFVREDPNGFLETDRALHPIDLELARLALEVPPSLQRVLIDLYDATIREADHKIGELLQFLSEIGLYENTVILLTSDHGEEFGEHGGLLHGRTVYEEVAGVPLLIRVPGVAPGRVSSAVSLEDIAPTLLGVAGLPADPASSGENLLQRVERESYADLTWTEIDARNMSERYTLCQGPYKLIYNPATAVEEPGYELRRPPEYELYHLERDPQETRNLWDEVAPAMRKTLLRRLQGVLADHEQQRRRVVADQDLLDRDLSPAQKEHLRKLGYVTDDR